MKGGERERKVEGEGKGRKESGGREWNREMGFVSVCG